MVTRWLKHSLWCKLKGLLGENNRFSLNYRRYSELLKRFLNLSTFCTRNYTEFRRTLIKIIIWNRFGELCPHLKIRKLPNKLYTHVSRNQKLVYIRRKINILFRKHNSNHYEEIIHVSWIKSNYMRKKININKHPELDYKFPKNTLKNIFIYEFYFVCYVHIYIDHVIFCYNFNLLLQIIAEYIIPIVND